MVFGKCPTANPLGCVVSWCAGLPGWVHDLSTGSRKKENDPGTGTCARARSRVKKKVKKNGIARDGFAGFEISLISWYTDTAYHYRGVQNWYVKFFKSLVQF